MEPIAIAPCSAKVLRSGKECALDRILDPFVQAVVYIPSPMPNWLGELAAAVESGAFCMPRVVLQRVNRDELCSWLASNLPNEAVTPAVHDALFDDIVALADRLAAHTGAKRFMLRIFTAAPTKECGFHVDTVAPGAPGWGLLRVYNGAGTEFVEPDNVLSADQFYRYLGKRERLERERREARSAADAAAQDVLEREIEALDQARAFLARPDEVFVAPAGAVVAFKHLDVRFHWAAHDKSKAWIHCSPMAGAPRLVVNLTCPDSAARQPR